MSSCSSTRLEVLKKSSAQRSYSVGSTGTGDGSPESSSPLPSASDSESTTLLIRFLRTTTMGPAGESSSTAVLTLGWDLGGGSLTLVRDVEDKSIGVDRSLF